MKRDAIKTLIVTLVILFSLGIAFLIVSNIEQGIELLTRSEAPFSDPDVKLMYETIEDNIYLRKASLDVNDLTDTDIIELVIDNLTKDDYKKKTYAADKIVCQVTKKIAFTTEEKKCTIRIIENKIFTDYIKKKYNLEKEMKFDDFEYHGYECKNSGKKYYCMYNSYKESIKGYSVFDKAYKTKDTLVISEYYLQVDMKDADRCLTYFDEEYCSNYKDMDRRDIGDKTIKKDGVLYEHVFTLVDGKYYLLKSYVKNEG